MGFHNPYKEGPFLFKVVAFIVGLIVLFDAFELLASGGRLFSNGLVTPDGPFSPQYYAEPETIVLVIVSFLYLIFGLLVMYRAYWVRIPLYALFCVIYLDTLYQALVELDLWGAIFNITVLMLLAAYVVWHAKYINESYPWRFLQWLFIVLIIYDFALGPVALYLPGLPTIDVVVVFVQQSMIGLWDWFYNSATTV